MTDPGAFVLVFVVAALALAVSRGVGPRTSAVRIGACSAGITGFGVVGEAVRARFLRASVRDREAASVGEFVEAWAAGLRAGAPVGAAFDSACADLPDAAALVPRSRAAVVVDDDVASALRRDAQVLHGPAARAVASAAACASIAGASGGRLADALDRIGDGLRADRQHDAHVRAQLAAPRATARLLAVLPVIALLLEQGAGMRPLSVLLDAPLGVGLVLAGVGLDVLGLWWTGRIARVAVRPA